MRVHSTHFVFAGLVIAAGALTLAGCHARPGVQESIPTHGAAPAVLPAAIAQQMRMAGIGTVADMEHGTVIAESPAPDAEGSAVIEVALPHTTIAITESPKDAPPVGAHVTVLLGRPGAAVAVADPH